MLWQESIDLIQAAHNFEGDMKSSTALTQVCGGNDFVKAKAVDTTYCIATTTRLSTEVWSLEAMRIDIPDLL